MSSVRRALSPTVIASRMLVLVLVVLAAGAAPARAQGGASIGGSVKDDSGGALPGAFKTARKGRRKSALWLRPSPRDRRRG